jgi:prepilin-type processing-associated H-X9-DG protein
MRRRKPTLLECVMILVPVALLAILLWPRSHTKRQGRVATPRPGFLATLFGQGSPHRSSCQSNLKQVGLGVLQYMQDYDESYPPVDFPNGTGSSRNPYGWADAIQPYIKSTRVYHCPTEGFEPSNHATKADYTDYWYNSRLSKVRAASLPDYFYMTIMAGDGNDGTDMTNARYNRSNLPSVWLNNDKSPARRHLDTANYLFADGHVKASKSAAIKNKVSATTFSFAIK